MNIGLLGKLRTGARTIAAKTHKLAERAKNEVEYRSRRFISNANYFYIPDLGANKYLHKLMSNGFVRSAFFLFCEELLRTMPRQSALYTGTMLLGHAMQNPHIPRKAWDSFLKEWPKIIDKRLFFAIRNPSIPVEAVVEIIKRSVPPAGDWETMSENKRDRYATKIGLTLTGSPTARTVEIINKLEKYNPILAETLRQGFNLHKTQK